MEAEKFIYKDILIYHYKSVNSTSDLVKNFSCEHKKLVIWADTQTSGRGRKKRDWVSPEGGLWFTLSYCPSYFPQKYLPYIVRISALALVKTLRSYNIASKVKPPNDIYVNGKKIAGILIDTEIKRDSVERIYIGVGLNINNSIEDMPEQVSKVVTTMHDLTSEIYSIQSVLFKILDNIFCEFEMLNNIENIDNLWNEVVLNKSIEV